jgi:hypothetical protein
MNLQPIMIEVDERTRVSALLQCPTGAVALYVFAHGAGAGMSHPFMAAAADHLAAHGIATLRYQFPYMEKGSRRPDGPALCHATVRGAIATARERAPSLPIFAGGKSFGGRMTSQTQAAAPLPGVVGLAFLGFPLHPPKQPSDARGDHLDHIAIPLLFLQGSRDEFAASSLLLPLVNRLGARASLKLFDGADHSFHVPTRSGRNDQQVRAEVLEALAVWAKSVMATREP